MSQLEYCCCKISLRNGSLALFIAGVIFNVLVMLYSAHIIVTFVYAIGTAINAAGIYGIFKEKPKFLIPWLICQNIGAICLSILTFLTVTFGGKILANILRYIKTISNSTYYDIAYPDAETLILMTFIFISIIALQVYFYIVVYSYYKKVTEINNRPSNPA